MLICIHTRLTSAKGAESNIKNSSMLNVACTRWRLACGAQRSNLAAMLECKQAGQGGGSRCRLQMHDVSVTTDWLIMLCWRGRSFKTGASKLVNFPS